MTVDTTSASVSGRRLARPHNFSFTTPTVRLLRTNGIRQSRRYDPPLVVILRFNQPVTHAGLAPHLELRYQPYDFTPPVLAPEGRERLAAAASAAPVPVSAAATWDQKTFPPSSDLLVWEVDGESVGASAPDRTLDWPLRSGRHTIVVTDGEGQRDQTTNRRALSAPKGW